MSQTLHIALEGRTYKVVLPDEGTATVDGIPIPAESRFLSPGILSLILTHPDGTTRSLRCILDPGNTDHPATVLIEGHRFPFTLSDPRSLRAASAAAGTDTGPRPLKSPMPGRVIRVLVAPGEQVDSGQGCVVIEAMKMQNELKAPKSGIITRLTATVGETVPSGATLLIVE